MKHRDNNAFTLIELLVVVGIIGFLLAIIMPGLGKARGHARMLIEMSAGRNLMLGHALYAHDNGERLIPGYDTSARATGPDGSTLPFPQNARYPWRLVPYLDDTLEQTVLVHQRRKEVESPNGVDTYSVSVMPSFGINGEFVGGTHGGPYNNWLTGVGVTVTRANDARQPAQLIVFTSARGGVSGTDPVLGYHMVQPAYGADYKESDLPAKFGFVHPRYSGRAVVSFLDTHAEPLSAEAMKDMTLWSDAAARAGNPNWTLSDAVPDR